MAKQRWLLSACGSAFLAGGIGGLGTTAFADLTMDLRLVSKDGVNLANAKSVTVNSGDTGAEFVLDLYAIVTEDSPTPSVGFGYAGGSFLSTGSAVLGNFAANGDTNSSQVKQVAVNPFADLGTVPGAATDLDGDTDLDLGSPDSDQLDQFVYVRDEGRGAGAGTAITGGREWRVGSVTFTLSGVSASGTTTLNWDPYRNAAGELSEDTALWYESSAIEPGNPSGSLTPIDPLAFFGVGTDVIFNITGVVFSEWAATNGGSWITAGNWTGAIPGGDAAVARFHGSNNTNGATVTVDAGRQVGTISFDNPNSYILSGGSLTLSNGAAPAIINLVTGNHTINTPMTAANGVTIQGTGTLTAGSITNNGAMAVNTNTNAGDISGTGSTTVAAGKTLNANHVRQNALTVNGTAAINANGGAAGTSVVNALNIAGATDAWTGKLDLKDNDMVVRSTAAGREADHDRLFNQLKAGIDANNPVGFWAGSTGITSSTAAANQSGFLTSIAMIVNDYATANLGTGPVLTDIGGVAVDINDVIMKYTWAGDADLNGTVDGGDYFLIDNGFAQSLVDGGWLNGDFDYNGVIDGGDFFLIDNAFAQQGSTVLGSMATAVPEPSVLSVFAAAGLGLLARRKRNK